MSGGWDQPAHAADDGIYGIDTAGICTTCNHQAAAILGYADPADLLGRPIHDLIHHHCGDGRSRPAQDCPIFAGMQSGTAVQVHDDIFWRHDGRPVAVAYRSHPLRKDGVLVGAMVSFRPLMEANDRLKRRNAVLELLSDLAVAANDADDAGDAFRDCLDRLCRFMDWPVGHVFVADDGTPARLVSSGIWHLADPPRYHSLVEATQTLALGPGMGLSGRVLASAEPVWIEDVRKDCNVAGLRIAKDLVVRAGFAFPVTIGASVVAVFEFFTPSATPPDPEIISCMRDAGRILGRVSERERARQAVMAAKQEAERASRAKSFFLTQLSHELRTPLNCILGFSEIITSRLRQCPDLAEHARYAQDIFDSGSHLLGLINDLLDLSRIESGKFPLNECVSDPGSLIESVVRTVQPMAEKRAIAISVHGSGDVGGLFADPRLIRQILINLLANSLKFTPATGVVTVGCEVDGDGQLLMEVADNGPGIPAEDLDRVLGWFEQSATSQTCPIPGSGLGLPLARKFAELHGGSLRLHCPAEGGTRATLILPPHRVRPKSGEGR